MKQTPWAQLQANFLTGLAVVLPAVISIAVLVWLFGTVSNITDTLLFAVPREWKYVNGVRGDIHWYWSLAALTLAMALVTFLGALARHYLGKKLIQTGDIILLRVPLLNKIYSTVKQVKEAFSGNKSSFQQTVLVEFPRPGMYSLGFLTADQQNEIQARTPREVWSVFIPTTPNPTTGFLLFLPEEEFTRLDMSVSDAIKCIISLGTVAPDYVRPDPAQAPVGTRLRGGPAEAKDVRNLAA
ncbi:MAG: DUF502 domain-containing protein [Verrucomicrobiae bacterium]|nr:DUF502 domain-containing protein [Verrucomicrobiae bacterium]